MKILASRLKELEDRFPTDSSKFLPWFGEYTELSAEIQEKHASISIAADVDTTNEKARELLEEVFETIFPELELTNQRILLKMDRKVLHKISPALEESCKIEKRTYSEKNITELAPRESMLCLRYSELTGGLSVEVGGEKLSIQEAFNLLDTLEEEDSPELFGKIVAAWQEIREDVNKIYLELLTIRREMAKNARFSNFRNYFFYKESRQWNPAQCERFHKQIEEFILPIQELIQKSWLKRGEIPNLKPWNLNPKANTDKIFETEEELEAILNKVMDRLEKIPSGQGRVMKNYQEHIKKDLMNRLNKKVGGYCWHLPQSNQNFIFMNSTGMEEDLFTFFHEMGHSLHHTLGFENNNFFNYMSPTEFAEVASMAMERIALKYLDGYDLKNIMKEKIEDEVTFLPYMSTVDQFQQWVYTTKGELTSEMLDAKWEELAIAHGGLADYTGYEEWRKTGWQRKTHIFEVPYYYIEYGLAQIGAWQIYSRVRKDEDKAFGDYLAALSLGGSEQVVDLYKRAGARFPFEKGVVEKYSKEIRAEYNKLNRL